MSHHERLMSPHDSLKIALLSDMFEIIDKEGVGTWISKRSRHTSASITVGNPQKNPSQHSWRLRTLTRMAGLASLSL